MLLHAGAMFGAGFAFSTTDTFEESRVVPVELITVAELTDIRASLERDRPEPEPVVEPEPMEVEESAENAPEEADAVDIAPDEESSAEPEAEPLTVPEETEPEAEPEPERVAEAKPSFDLDRISTLIDKSQDTSTAADTQVAQEGAEDKLVYADQAREGIGTGTQMTLSELDALNSAMYRCWRKPIDATDLEKLVVRLRVDMEPGGFVKDVRVIDRAASRRAAPGNPFWDVAEMRAVQAVSKCAPYDFLPSDKFDQWQSLILNFRPQS
ncbi:hypothetical protein [uncultured Algimonas sp.]|uniref:hypothetical protein n=1 Tax=uncultured Algimonas sp. TaxID=1547920 RepID=UPI0026122E04|nr:hypothetical protein [uncultured Algimonas sp.]